MVGEGEGDAGGSGEEAGVVVGSAVFGVLDQVSVVQVGCRVDLSCGVSGEIWMGAGGCGPIYVVVEGTAGVGQGGLGVVRRALDVRVPL